jgi:serine protease DegQ
MMSRQYSRKTLAIALSFTIWSGLSILFPIYLAPATARSRVVRSPQEIKLIATAIAVKIFSGSDVLGTGFLIKKQGNIYTVVTNAHVLRAGELPYTLQVRDRIYPAKPISERQFCQNDLALLQFHSSHNYAVAVLSSSFKLTKGQDVFVAGYSEDERGYKSPINERQELPEFVFNRGKVSLILDKALAGGYQIGYTNELKKGMSGGPLLNRWGEVVGINGKHAYPLWNAPSIYQDGSQVRPALNQAIDRYSWAIPISTLLQLAPTARFSSQGQI